MHCFMDCFDFFQVLGAMFYAESLHRPQTSIRILNAIEHEGCDKWLCLAHKTMDWSIDNSSLLRLQARKML